MLILSEGNQEYLVEGYTLSELRKMLGQGTVVISFNKVSTGKDRIMYCTRRMDMIPTNHHPKGGPSKIPPGNLAVFDLIKKGWRSFRINTVHKAEPKKLNFLTKILRKNKYSKDHKAGTNELQLRHPDRLGESFEQNNSLQPIANVVLYHIDYGFKGHYNARSK